MEDVRRRPSRETLEWVERSVGAGASVVAWRRLTGGITSSVHRLSVKIAGSDRPEYFVLRRWVGGSHNREAEARDAVLHEGRVLHALASHSIPAPEVIATTDGSEAGAAPALLMTRAPGKMNLTPSEPRAWIAQMARMLSRIHALAIDVPQWESWTDATKLEIPKWASHPAVWRAAIDSMINAPVDPPTCFIHRDYQHFNLLWRRDKLTAVIDWVNASTGPPDIDVGHCRLNLAVLFSSELADEFLHIYEAEAGRAVDPRWDIHSLMSYDEWWQKFIPVQVGGRRPIDLEGMHGRVEQTLAAAVRRL